MTRDIMLPSAARKDPVGALTWIEATAALLAFVADMYRFTLVTPHGGISLRLLEWLFAAVSLATAAAIFSMPHTPNRRFVSAGIAIIGVVVLGVLPTRGVTTIVLLAALAARLTFAFGFRGAILAWTSACVSLPLAILMETHGDLRSAELPALADEAFGLVVELGLIFGIIAVMSIYAAKNASAAASAERARIALELHDSLGHGLTTLGVHLQNATRMRTTDPQRADSYVARAATAASDLLGDVRETVTLLHDDGAPEVDPLRLLLDELRTNFSATHDLEIDWTARVAREPSGRVTVALYRVLQEALTNVARHAGAAHVRVEVRGERSEIELRVEDDGCGFSGDANGHGLAFMRMRVESVGGTIAVTSEKGAGTSVHVLIPLEASA